MPKSKQKAGRKFSKAEIKRRMGRISKVGSLDSKGDIEVEGKMQKGMTKIFALLDKVIDKKEPI